MSEAVGIESTPGNGGFTAHVARHDEKGIQLASGLAAA